MVLELVAMGPTEIAKDFGPNYFREANNRGLNVSQYLERLDPTRRYRGEERNLDAFERLTEVLGFVPTPIVGEGIRASTYEEVTKDEVGRAWYAEFCSRVWRQAASWDPVREQTRSIFHSGDYTLNSAQKVYDDDLSLRSPRLEVEIPLDTVISGTRNIDGDAYRSVYITDSLTNDAYRLKRVGEGADIPATSLVTGEHYLRIHKFGRGIRYTYEQMRRQRLDRIGFLLSRMALMAEADKVALALDTMVLGDGNANTAATVYAQTALHPGSPAGQLTLQAWEAFKARFSPYIPRIVIGQEAAVSQLKSLPLSTGNSIPLVMAAGGNAYGNLVPINPLAWTLRYGQVATSPALKLVTFDPAWAVEMVAEIGATISELEKYVSNQTWLLTMTETNGFATIDPLSVRVLNINA